MKKFITSFIAGIVLTVQVMSPGQADAACAKVTLEILQPLTLERVAFDAKLVLTNNVPDSPLEEVRLDVIIKNNAGVNSDSMFFVRKPVLTGVNALDGTGTVASGAKAEAHWLIIPSPGAGVTIENGIPTQIGVDYLVGATLTYTIAGKKEVVAINPDKITVKPMPQLVLDYFLPFNVLGDNPFTVPVEAPVPYSLALRVFNDGYGPADKLKIFSAQPRITKNDQGLLIDFKLLGTTVNDSAASPSLTVNFGDIPSKKAATAYWQMISTLTGRFIEFKAEFSHASELGGELTSFLRETNAHYLNHMIKVNLPGRDALLDFLAQTDTTDKTNVEHFPDAIYESEIPNGSTDLATARTPVTVLLPTVSPTRPTSSAPTVQLELPTGQSGWIYTRLPDPAAGLLKLLDVTRSDGVHLDPHNFWVEEGVDKGFNRIFTLHFVDYRMEAAASGSYTIIYTTPDIDTVPPVTTLVLDGTATGSAPFYIPLETRILLTARDNDGGSGVASMFKRVVGQDELFVASYPFSFDAAGSYTLEYYSSDRAGNVESTKSARIIAVSAAPEIKSFTALPSLFAPQAPKGVVALRSVDFIVKATSVVPSLPVELAIASGSAFDESRVVRTIKGVAVSATDLKLTWDGKDANGNFVSSGPYTVRLKVSDGLENLLVTPASPHSVIATASITVADWFTSTALDPNPTAEQLHPRASGKKIVWQDLRNGNWDIYLKDTTSGIAATQLTTDPANQQWPSIDGTIVVWQDYRNGNWDIYGYDLAAAREFAICTEAGDQERPVISGDWVVWQDNRNGNGDIYAYNISTKETVRITSHERDQLHPAISGTMVAWEDYRYGTGDIFSYDLTARSEARVTTEPQNQSQPGVSGSTLTWTDQRNGQQDIYAYTPSRGTLQITFGAGEHTQSVVAGDTLVYTDFEAGTNDPNLSYRVLSSGTGGRLSSNPARQEEPTIGDKLVAWQDSRDGKYQIYTAALELEALPVEATLQAGMNLVAVGAGLAAQYPTAAALLTSLGSTLGIERILAHDPVHNTYSEATPGSGDFALIKGMGLTIYAGKSGMLTLAGAGETASYTLLPGANQIGILTVPFGYTAYDLVKSIGQSNIQSVRRYDNVTGSWQTVALRDTATGSENIGSNFTINSGEALIITMKNRVDGWSP